MSASGIAKILNKNCVLAPSEYKAKCGEKYSTSFKGAGQSKWSAQTVSRILKNVVYIGTLAQGKRTTVSHKVKKEIAVPECDWVVVENAHEAIISRMDFDAVQILMSRDTIAVAGKTNHICMREFYIVVIVAAVWFIARSHTRAGNISTISVLIITGTVKMPAVVTASVRRT